VAAEFGGDVAADRRNLEAGRARIRDRALDQTDSDAAPAEGGRDEAVGDAHMARPFAHEGEIGFLPIRRIDDVARA